MKALAAAAFFLTASAHAAQAGPCDRLHPPVLAHDAATMAACIRELQAEMESLRLELASRRRDPARDDAAITPAQLHLHRALLCSITLDLQAIRRFTKAPIELGSARLCD